MRKTLKRLKWPVVAIFSVVAVVTPSPDAVTLLAYALPLVVVYGLGLAHGARAIA